MFARPSLPSGGCPQKCRNYLDDGESLLYAQSLMRLLRACLSIDAVLSIATLNSRFFQR